MVSYKKIKNLPRYQVNNEAYFNCVYGYLRHQTV